MSTSHTPVYLDDNGLQSPERVLRNGSLGFFDTGGSAVDTISRRLIDGEACIELDAPKIRIDTSHEHVTPNDPHLLHQLESLMSRLDADGTIEMKPLPFDKDHKSAHILIKTADMQPILKALSEDGLISGRMADFVSKQDHALGLARQLEKLAPKLTANEYTKAFASQARGKFVGEALGKYVAAHSREVANAFMGRPANSVSMAAAEVLSIVFRRKTAMDADGRHTNYNDERGGFHDFERASVEYFMSQAQAASTRRWADRASPGPGMPDF